MGPLYDNFSLHVSALASSLNNILNNNNNTRLSQTT